MAKKQKKARENIQLEALKKLCIQKDIVVITSEAMQNLCVSKTLKFRPLCMG